MSEADLIALNGRWWDYEVYQSDNYGLVIVGSIDLGYHHDVAISFRDVRYLETPWQFSYPSFRLPTNDENARVSGILGRFDGCRLYVADVEASGSDTRMFVVANEVDVVE